ncbi:hypothetical protein AAEX28_03210 [Lentisphaerota bacterium WC36G]|nr:hypothetical protein LJT99_06085 [Lentisphaerae bacterium WC36]
MSPSKNFHEQFLYDTKNLERPINAVSMAIQNYIAIRERWLKKSVGFYGLRGSVTGGKIFMNRTKTKKNLETMQEIHVLLNDSTLDYRTKIEKIKVLKVKLTKKGQALKLIDTFLETAVADNCAYIPSRNSLEESVYVARQTVFRRRDVLGRGAFGSAERFASEQSGKSFVVKQFHNPYVSASEVSEEIEIFRKVYNKLGRKYFGDDFEPCVVQAPTEESHEGKVLMPEVPGGSLESYCRDNLDFDEDALFTSIFNFLFSMHYELGVAHRDCHVGNIMVVDKFYNVFFIDYGMACQNDGAPIFLNKSGVSDFVDAAREDVAMCICDLFFARKLKGDHSDIKVKEVIFKFQLIRWMNFIFMPDETDPLSLEKYLVKKVNYFNRLVGVKAKLLA